MTAVNESNGAERARREGYAEGHHDGYYRGREVGYEVANHRARREFKTIRLMEYVIALLLGVAISLLIGNIKEANAATAETTLKVTIVAEVACNPENCPVLQAGDEIIISYPATSSSAQEESTLWSRMVKWIQKLFE